MLILAIGLACGVSVFADTVEIDGRTWSYSVGSDGTATVEKVSPSDGSVKIPSSIDGYVVTSIGESAFSSGRSLLSVMIPSSVTSKLLYNISPIKQGI